MRMSHELLDNIDVCYLSTSTYSDPILTIDILICKKMGCGISSFEDLIFQCIRFSVQVG